MKEFLETLNTIVDDQNVSDVRKMKALFVLSGYESIKEMDGAADLIEAVWFHHFSDIEWGGDE